MEEKDVVIMDNRYMTIHEVAKYIGISPERAIRAKDRWKDEAIVLGVKLRTMGRKPVCFVREDVIAFFKAKEQ